MSKSQGKLTKSNFTKSLSPLCKNVFVPPNLLWTIMARNDDVSCMLHKRVTIHNSIISSKAAISNTEKGQHYLASPQPCRTHNLVKSFLQEHSCFLRNASFQIYFFSFSLFLPTFNKIKRFDAIFSFWTIFNEVKIIKNCLV